jgi:hypothetical protein
MGLPRKDWHRVGKNFPELLRDIPILLHAGSIEGDHKHQDGAAEIMGFIAILGQKETAAAIDVPPGKGGTGVDSRR